MIIDIKSYNLDNILDEYVNRLKDNTVIKREDGENHVIFSTPYLDSYNDYIELIAYKKWDKIIMSDDWWTIANLNMKWVELSTGKRATIFNQIINWLWVSVSQNNELFIETDISRIWQKKHSLMQAILAVWDMYVLSKQNVISLFKEEVESYFTSNDLYPSKDMKITWKTWYDHMIDFIFNPTKDRNESLIKVINKPKKDSVMSALFSFNDIKHNKPNSDFFVFLNDINEEPSQEVMHALTQYDVKTKLRSQKTQTILPYFTTAK
jgi:Domain of unknown function DUF1828/Domain of unknown function DUF1829